MTTIVASGSFTAVGAGSSVVNRSDGELLWTIANTFVGSVALEFSEASGGIAWQRDRSQDLITRPGSGSVRVSKGTVYRFRCRSFTSGQVDWTVTPTEYIDATAIHQNGKTILTANTTPGISTTLGGYLAGASLVDNALFVTAFGSKALYSNTQASPESSAFGAGALNSCTTGTQNNAFGIQALGQNVDGSFNSAFGTDAMRDATSPANCVAMGTSAMQFANTVFDSVALGLAAFKSNVNATSSGNVIAIGSSAHIALHNVSATDNIAIGYQAMGDATGGPTTANCNIAIGSLAGSAISTGVGNVVVGWKAAFTQTTALNNTYIGYFSGAANLTAGDNTAVGASTLAVATGLSNTAIGSRAGTAMTTGTSNVLLGKDAGGGITTGAANVIVGVSNVATAQITTGSHNLSIGPNAQVQSATASNQITIMNLIYGTGASGTGATVSPGRIGIGHIAPNAALTLGDQGGTLNDAHLGVLQTTAPTVTNGTLDATASDVAGTVTCSAANPVITFNHTWATIPHVVISSPTGTVCTYAVSTTAITITGGLATNKFTYVCIQ